MDIEKSRFNMIEQQIRPWDVLDTDVLDLLSVVKREHYVPEAYRALAFVDMEIPLAGGQNMLAPRVEARVLQELAALNSEDGPADRSALERLWAAASVATLTGGHNGGSVACVAFAPDGNCLATGARDATVRLWLAPPLDAALAERVESPTYLPPTDTFRLF